MRRIHIGTSGIEASAMTIGTWEMGGGTAWGSWGARDEAEYVKVLHAAPDLGVDFIDTAPVYGTGHSEELIGKALAGRRSKYVISTKCGIHWRDTDGVREYERDGKTAYRNLAAYSIRKDLEDSLRRLQTDYVDLYYTHRQSDDTPVEETMGELLRMKQEGKIRAIGISKSKPAHLEAYLRVGRVDAVQEEFNVLDRAFGGGYLDLCSQHGVIAHCYGSLAKGLLTGRIGADYVPAPGSAQNSVWFRPALRSDILAMLDEFREIAGAYGCSLANLATAWVLSRSPLVTPVIGIRRMESLVDSIKSFDVKLTPDDVSRMDCLAQSLANKAAATSV
ncbi:MAG: aldo/keto reductase [Clostridiaceae bacterium]|nr:aldo/keto reductase [Clostridiaceae bacterium]